MASQFNDNLHQHISTQFDQELVEIQSRVLTLGGMVEEQIEQAMRSVVEGNAELAEQVIASDFQINAMEVAIDEECTHILARRQPTARDLRLVVAVIKTINDLERIGDEAKRIARYSIDMALHLSRRNQMSELTQLARHVLGIVRSALDAFARMDVEQSIQILQDDRQVDREYESILRQQITYMMEDPRSIPVALDVMWSARALERIGDRSCNICEYVIYYAKGKNVRHIDDLDLLRKRLLEG